MLALKLIYFNSLSCLVSSRFIPKHYPTLPIMSAEDWANILVEDVRHDTHTALQPVPDLDHNDTHTALQPVPDLDHNDTHSSTTCTRP